MVRSPDFTLESFFVKYPCTVSSALATEYPELLSSKYQENNNIASFLTANIAASWVGTELGSVKRQHDHQHYQRDRHALRGTSDRFL